MDMASALALPAGMTQSDAPYLPRPNRIDVVLSAEVGPRHLTRTAFMLPLLADGRLVMAVNRRRGPEIPGGHIDPGEDAEQAAQRELLEETGCQVGDFQPLGFLRMVSDGTVPPGWNYPHPVGFQQFYTGIVTARDAYLPNDECLEPLVLDHKAAMDPHGPLNPGQRFFYHAARSLVFAQYSGHADAPRHLGM
jgi:8-oxo-dGTP diphosphatase